MTFTIEGTLKCTDFISNNAYGPDISLFYIWLLNFIIIKFRGSILRNPFKIAWFCINPLLVLHIFCYTEIG